MMQNEDMRRQSDVEDDRELDQLIRWSLQAVACDEEPSDKVWQRIQAGLDGGPIAFPEDQPGTARRPWVSQLASVAAAVFLAFGVMLSVQMSSDQSSLMRKAFATPSNQSAPVVISNEDVQSGRLAFLAEREHIRMQRSLSPEADPLLVYRHWRG
jgi:hypothetical protein